MPKLRFWMVFLLPALLVAGVLGGGAWNLAVLAFVFVLVPGLDPVLGIEKENPAEDAPARRWLLDLPLVVWLPLQVVYTVWALAWLSSGALSGFEAAALTLSLGVLNGGAGINIAHELMHRRERFPRACAELLMASVSYTHFCVEHVLGHHRRVATPEDPATSRLGESLYAFLPRTLVGGLRSAWHLEGERSRKKGIPAWSLRNRRLRYPLGLAALYGAVFAAFGGVGVLAFAVQGLVAVLLLEVVNYLEHYGLQRRETSPGRYERVRPQHSWNASQRVSSALLFNLSRHSDHHFLASRPYDALRHYEDVPQLPAGYATMVLVALCPPLWFRLMDRRVADWSAHEETRETPRPLALAA